MDKSHEVESVSFLGTVLHLRVDGKDYEIDVAEHSAKLTRATPEQRGNFAVSPSGYGIHWPALDEDLSVDGLIGIKHSCPIDEARVQTNG